MEQEFELVACIGFKGSVPGGLIIHPDNEHMLFPLGCTVVVRNLLQRTQVFLQGHDDEVSCIAVSPSGKLIASGQKTHIGFPADVIIWNFEERAEMHRLSLHKGAVASLSFSFDEQYIATLGGQDDNALVCWDVASGSAVCGSPAYTETARAVKFFNTSAYHLITGGKDHVRVWEFDLQNKKVRPTQVKLDKLRRTTTNIVVDAEDACAYCGTETGDVLEVSLAHAALRRTFPGKLFGQGVTAQVVLPNGDVLLGTGAGVLAIVSGERMRVVKKVEVMGGVTSIAPTADFTHFFVGTAESNIYWVDLETLTPELRNTCHHDGIHYVAFPYGYSDVFATCSSSDVRVWNTRTRQELLRIQVPNLEAHCLDFTRDGRQILTGWSDGRIRAFLPQSGRLKFVINDAHRNSVTALAAYSDCSHLVSGGEEGEVRVWKLDSAAHTMLASMKEHRGRVNELRLKGDNSQVISASADGSCIVWDLTTFTRCLCLFESTTFKGMVLHPDESQLLTCGTDRKIAYWELYDGQAIRVLEGSEDGDLNALAISKSGSHYVSTSNDRLVKVWDYDLGTCTHIGVGHSGTITSAAISPDQKYAVTVGAEGAIFVWQFDEALVERAHQTAE